MRENLSGSLSEYRRHLLTNPSRLAACLDDLLTPAEVAVQFPGLAPSAGALKQQRRRNRGPRFLKLGGAIRYRRLDILAFLERCTIYTATDPVDGGSE